MKCYHFLFGALPKHSFRAANVMMRGAPVSQVEPFHSSFGLDSVVAVQEDQLLLCSNSQIFHLLLNLAINSNQHS
jgi:hypothetical protein